MDDIAGIVDVERDGCRLARRNISTRLYKTRVGSRRSGTAGENGRIVSSVMAGVAFEVEGDGVGFSNQILRRISALHHARQPLRCRLANKTG